MTLAAQLAHGLAELRMDLPAATQQRLIDYLALIRKWNRIYNLTAVREPRQMVSHHLLDSLVILPHVEAHTLLDVGSGAGLPGIPLALALPLARVTLLDANHKKATFLRQAAIDLRLDNVEVVCERIEAWRPREKFELVVSRAFSELPDFIERAGRMCEHGGTLAAMKGVYPHEEIAQLPAGYRIEGVRPLHVPCLRGERHLVLVKQA